MHNVSIVVDDKNVSVNSQFMLRNVLVQKLKWDVYSHHSEEFTLNIKTCNCDTQDISQLQRAHMKKKRAEEKEKRQL